ncbi:flagellar basal body L-ring protein FlgH [Pontibacterium granulatum]|uniref:flagellar basal body L-ring protein FlgH n=1 Tax=Pontibacterium granulatum TaxID=2036029 RepID=UPI00249A2846|nr:flagellar basal body L-ring protein FlgH [Pontibacterium granulatum]MDI3322915.1 flagellar basal body L-ring protein FlgH [Pontibacterium granulatum]
MNTLAKVVLGSMLVASLTGCVQKVAKPNNPYYAPVQPQALQQVRPVTGSIYSAATSRDIYGDGRATRIGDIITVVLTESTQSSKSAKTSLDKSNEFNLPQPTLFGHGVSAFGNPISAAQAEASTEFEGEGKSDMSNSLSGNITVTVHDVLPNGSLIVRGEKWLTLNQGEEYIRVSGLVRPQDVSQDNTVPSTKLADARIEYAGNGAVSDTNATGWLARFFINPLWPF